MECKKQENLKNCPCSYPDCPRKGICCECLRYHLQKRNCRPAFFHQQQKGLMIVLFGNLLRINPANFYA